MSIYTDRRSRIYEWMSAEHIDAAYLTKDADVRYLTGMPNDSVLLLFGTGRAVLLPWDIILAEKLAEVDTVVPYTEYHRDLATAVTAQLGEAGLASDAKVEIPAGTAYPKYQALAEKLPEVELVCRSEGIEEMVGRLRSRKDSGEIAILRRAAEITNGLIDDLERALADGSAVSELDIALFLEREARARGGEGTGFESLVAGPQRSNNIHAFPACTAGRFASPGLGIVDFGVRVDGYTSDVTITAVFGRPDEKQREMVELVERAYAQATREARPGADAGDIARRIDALFDAAGYAMPHSLGHGVGLEVHEAPWVRSRATDPVPLEPGMVFTIEPGLYHAEAGGVRLENDVLITDSGAEVITTSRILRFPDFD